MAEEKKNKVLEDLGICQRCNKRKADLVFSAEPTLALTHGWGKENICRFCFINQLKKHIRDCNKQLKEMTSKQWETYLKTG
jgi:hypothetical protein